MDEIEKKWRRAASKFERWVEQDDELFPVHTCRMVVSVVRHRVELGGQLTLEIEYVYGSKRFDLCLMYEGATKGLIEIMDEYEPGDEDAAGVYWRVSSKSEFVAFQELPDIKTAVRYIDTVYTQ